ncbi:AAA family ATPase [Candidatus Thiodictyon syntrophicum]|jgi:MoxR-like ATPase|nr:MoxR family ATPase [Candidatus Thiodictyon syntrophicum]
MTYRFDLLEGDSTPPAGPLPDLAARPFIAWRGSFADDARHFVPGRELTDAMQTAIALGDPLLLTGEPGTGKTQAAYWAAWRLGIGEVLHFQVKSDSTARDLLYRFDAVRYFHEANLRRDRPLPAKRQFIDKRELWQAFDSGHPRLVLIDEIDKAPRDFPNDLLLELDRMRFQVAETGAWIAAAPANRPILFITSNSERRLPEPFLRRCVYHHIRFDAKHLNAVINARRDEFAALPDALLTQAVERFLSLRDCPLRRLPATGECLVWLRVMALAAGRLPSVLAEDLSKLPFIETLVKDHEDRQVLSGGRGL